MSGVPGGAGGRCQRPQRGDAQGAYAWSKSDLEIPRFLRIRWSVPVARSRFPCLGMGVSRSFVGQIYSRAVPASCAALGRSRGHREASLAGPLWRTSGGRGTPRSWRDWIRALATARSSSSVCSGVSPQAMQPGRDLRQVHPAFALLRFVKNVVQLVDVHLFSSG